MGPQVAVEKDTEYHVEQGEDEQDLSKGSAGSGKNQKWGICTRRAVKRQNEHCFFFFLDRERATAVGAAPACKAAGGAVCEAVPAEK